MSEQERQIAAEMIKNYNNLPIEQRLRLNDIAEGMALANEANRQKEVEK